MSLEIKIDDRIAKVRFIEMKDNMITLQVDERIYHVDVLPVGDLIYSLIHEGKSYNIEMIQGESSNHYYVNSLFNAYHIEILDPASRLRLGKGKEEPDSETGSIVCPMPAKVVKVMVKEGEAVSRNQTLVVVSAMKMEIDFKSQKDGRVRKIHVAEEDTVKMNEILIELD